MNYYIGIDIGSTTTQIVVCDKNHKIKFLASNLTGSNLNDTSNKLIAEAKKALKCKTTDFSNIIATGYGRKLFHYKDIPKSDITEITCYAKGGNKLNQNVRTIIDIGGQDSKVISLHHDGRVKNFVMNDKCAAGTGKFLEMIACQFNISLDELSMLSSNATESVMISNICAVFAQSEIINMISKGISMENITKSAEESVVSRIIGMAERLGIENDVMFCGGVAKNQGMIRCLEEKIQREIYIPKNVEFVGAYGAAIFAAEK